MHPGLVGAKITKPSLSGILGTVSVWVNISEAGRWEAAAWEFYLH
jgi:hypothetical protein